MLGLSTPPTDSPCDQLRDFLGTIRFQPNRFRTFDDDLPASIPGFPGIQKVNVHKSTSVPGQLSIVARGRAVTLVPQASDLPLEATVVVDTPLATGGQCGEVAFGEPAPLPLCGFNALGTAVLCH